MTESKGPFGLWSGYVSGGVHPMSGYAVLVGIFAGLWTAFLVAVRAGNRTLPKRIHLGDIVLLGIGTYRLSRLITKDSVTSIFRAPFTHFEHPIGDGEVEEKPRGTGLQHAIGELIVCPYCVGQWVASLFAFGFVLRPRFTRLVAATLTMYALADAMQLGMDAAKRIVLHMPQGR